MIKHEKLWNNTEYLLGLAAAALLFLFIYLNTSIELKDPDIWLHLKTGEYIVQQKDVPRADMFSFTLQNKPWLDHSWLVQVIFYLVFRSGGADNLILFSALTVTAAFFLLLLCAYRGKKDFTLSISLLFLVALASKTRFNIRPENFSLLFFSAYLFLLTRFINTKWIFLLIPIQLLWANCHGFFILGPLVVGAFIAVKSERAKLIRLFLWLCLASLMTPYGLKGFFYPFWVALGSIGKPNIFYNYIQELLPTWRYFDHLSAYYLLIILSFSLFVVSRKRINYAHLILWLIFLGLSLRVNRNAVYFNFIAFLASAEILLRGQGSEKSISPKKVPQKPLYLLKYLILLVIIFSLLSANSSILKSRYYIFEENRFKSQLFGVAAKKYPAEAAEFILKNNLPANIFNQFNYGSYLIYRLFPERKVFIDGRTELYGDEFFKNYQKILHADKKTIAREFSKYGINTVLLKGIERDTAKLSAYLFYSPQWTVVYFDGDSIIFLKNSEQNKALADKLSVDLKKWVPGKIDFSRIGFKAVSPSPYLKRAWVFYYLGLYEQSIMEAKDALRISPASPDSYNILGRIYLKKGSLDKAFEYLRLANIYAPESIETCISLGAFYTKAGKFDAAVNTYRKLTYINKYFAQGYYLLGESYERINKNTLAVNAYRSALRLNQFDPLYYKKLGELLRKNGDLKGALKAYESAIALGIEEDYFKSLKGNLAK